MAQLLVKYEDVEKVFEKPPVRALDPCTFDVEKNQFISIIGKSGCGKSTLLRITCGLTDYTSGVVTVNGRQVKGPTIETGMVFQNPALLKWRSVLDNIILPSEFLHLDKNESRKKAKELVELMGLSGSEKLYPFQLSGGMQHRVSLARALLYDPMILLMDEPFSSLDALTRDQLDVELAQICERGKTVVFVTHSIPEAVLLSDKVIVLTPRPGRVKAMFDIDLPRPRTHETRKLPKFTQLAEMIREKLT